MLDKAQAYEARLSSLKVDTRRLFPMEVRGFPAATERLIQLHKDSPRLDVLDKSLER